VVNNCRLDLEDYEYLAALPQGTPDTFASFDAPPEVTVEWHRNENQGALGSCNGTAGASCLERAAWVRDRQKVQLSKIFAYLGSQKVGGLLGYDQGSRPTDFIKLAMSTGVCPESMTGYPAAYPNGVQIKTYLSAANYAAGAPFKAQSVCVFRKDSTIDEFKQFIGGGGSILFGCRWYRMIPADRVVRSYSPPATARLGHAMSILGYRQNLIGLNSHNDGAYEITAKALEQLLRYPGNVFVGLMGNEGKPVDWVKDSPWNFKG